MFNARTILRDIRQRVSQAAGSALTEGHVTRLMPVCPACKTPGTFRALVADIGVWECPRCSRALLRFSPVVASTGLIQPVTTPLPPQPLQIDNGGNGNQPVLEAPSASPVPPTAAEPAAQSAGQPSRRPRR